MTRANPPFHPISELFPPMTEQEFEELVKSIAAEGQLEPITTLDGLVTDGRHRWSACLKLGIEPVMEEWEGTEEDLIRYTIAKNLHRRHLTSVQKAAVALKVATLDKGEKTRLKSGSVTQGTAAKMLGVSPDSIQRMKKVQEQGDEGLVVATLAGDIPLAKAAKIAALSKEQQREVLEAAARIREASMQERREKARRKVEESRADSRFPDGKFMLAIIDPPWSYGNPAMTTHMNPGHHYDEMSIEEIMALPVEDSLETDALVAIWTTSFHLSETLSKIIPAWGLEYSATAVWKKPKAVVGAGILRQTSEFVVFAKRGKGVGKPDSQLISVFEAPQGRHSQKPPVIHEWMESAFPEWMPKVEFFARNAREGWAFFGNDPALIAA